MQIKQLNSTKNIEKSNNEVYNKIQINYYLLTFNKDYTRNRYASWWKIVYTSHWKIIKRTNREQQHTRGSNGTNESSGEG